MISNPRRGKGTYTAGVVTRESVLNEAIELIAAKGYYGFSLRDVARLVGISHPAVIYHFPTKQVLLYACMKRIEDKLGVFDVELGVDDTQLIDRGIIPENIGKLGLAILDLALSKNFSSAVSFDMSMVNEAREDTHPLYGHYRYKFDTIITFLVKGINALKETGIVASERNANLIAERFISLWYGSLLTAHYMHANEPSTTVIGQYLAEVGRILGLHSETILEIAVAIPERLAPAFQKAMRASQLIL